MLGITSAIEQKKHEIVQEIQDQSQLYHTEEEVYTFVIVFLIHLPSRLLFLKLPVDQVTFGRVGVHNPILPVIEEEVVIGLPVECARNTVIGQ